MKKCCLAFLALFLATAGALQADQITAAVQQALKEQGFYYGDVTGEKTSDTTAAIRRYQIRNGLQVTGEIDAETLRSLGVGTGSARATLPPPSATPPPVEEAEANNDENATQPAEVSPPPGDGPGPAYGPGPTRHERRAGVSGVFAGTPYEMAPPDLQRHVIVGTQTLLARYGFYRSGIDGEFGPGTEAAVRAFQVRAGLVPDGRLNMATLAALGLLPGQHPPGMVPPPRRLLGQPVYRGEWIPDR